MHMHPTVTHAAADHRRQDYLTEAAAAWNQRPEIEQPTIRRKTQLIWHLTSAMDCFLSWLIREFAPTPQAIGPKPQVGHSLSVFRPR